MPTVRTELLDITYKEGGPTEGLSVLLLHGWPNAPRGWSAVAQRLHAAGYRIISPYLRGTAPTQFLDPNTPRSVRAWHWLKTTSTCSMPWS